MSFISSSELNRFSSANVLHTQLQLHHQMLYRQHNMTHHHHPEEITNNGWLLPPTPGAGPTLSGDVTVSLKNAKLWQQFHSETTEMIITKLGRRMFPDLQLQIDGLERRSRYCLLLEIAPASRRRHKYVGGGGGGGENGIPLSSRGWTSAGPAEPQPHVNRRVYLHPESPATGTHWMQHPVSFKKLKLTNNAVDRHSNVVLTSMHKYVPRIWIVRCDDIARLTSIFSQPASSFCFPETEFIAVTAYQNENITKLKIDNNPFAKGFRETGQSRCKRKMQSSFDTSHQIDGIRTDDETRYVEDEESNVSCSEFESNGFTNRLEDSGQHHRVKRAASETGSLDDSGVSSSGSASPPLIPTKKEESVAAHPQPRLHRPWTDENDNDNENDLSESRETLRTENRRQNHHHHHHSLQHQNYYHLKNNRQNFQTKLRRIISPVELARFQQIQQIQHYQQIHYEHYYQINQINQLKNLALQIPFDHTNTTQFHQFFQSHRNKFNHFQLHSSLSASLSPSESSKNGASPSS